MHYVAMGVALLIAILTTTEIMWQNVNERKSQLAVLKATGWQDVQIRLLVLSEGMMTGLCAGVIGLLTALGMIGFVYGQFPVQELGFLSIMLLIPVITGLLGALLPAERAVRITPNAALGSVVENTQATERRFKWALGSIAASLCIGVASLFLFASTESSTTTPQSTPPKQQTSGQKLKDLASAPKTSADKKSGDQTVLKKLMKKGVIQTYPGDPEATSELFYAKSLIPTPKELNLKEKTGYRYVTIPVVLYDPYTTEKNAFGIYRPGTFTITSLDGKEYETVDYVNHNKKAFRNSYQYLSPYKSTVDLVYQVPDDQKVFVLFAADDAFPKDTTVKIELD